MNPNPRDPDKLAEVVDRELKALPDMQAPSTLLPRVMALIATQTPSPWYRKSWQAWPVPLQIILLLGLTLSFGGLYVVAARIPQSDLVMRLTNEIQAGLALASIIWNALVALAGVAERLFKGMNISPAIIAGCCGALILAYAACLSLGAVYLKLALTRKKEDNL